MPERSNISLIEDKDFYTKLITKSLTREGHIIVSHAKTVAEAEDAIAKFEELGVQVAVLDGNLDLDEESGNDGEKLASLIKERAPEVIIVGMSGGEVRGAHVDIGKSKALEIGKIVTEL